MMKASLQCTIILLGKRKSEEQKALEAGEAPTLAEEHKEA